MYKDAASTVAKTALSARPFSMFLEITRYVYMIIILAMIAIDIPM